ncbi:MAG: P-type conjugative transfer ATPase TrbB [Verrucomicrobia bacterium]|nr:P-type conjugative transfer ATPase TrbB [Verrucomicrobiota bacterium]
MQVPGNESHRRAIAQLRSALGPMILGALEDPLTVEVMLNADGRLWQERLGAGIEELGRMESHQAEALIRCVASALNVTVGWDRPLFEGELPIDGSRFAAQLPPIVSAPCFAIRKKANAVYTLDQYVQSGIMTSGQQDILCSAVAKHRNVIVSGSTGSGKTTLLNALIAEGVRQFGKERLILIEDTKELACSAANFVQFHTSLEVDMTQLVRTAMRMRPDRILIGEVRGPEALDLLKAWNTGHEGGLATVHANDARSALSRLESLVSENPHPPKPIQPIIAEAVHIVVHIARDEALGRRIREIGAVAGYSPDTGYQIRDLSK